MVVVLLMSYETMFFSDMSTIVTVMICVLLRDSRCFVMILAWISFFNRVFSDAALIGLRFVLIADIIPAAGYVFVAGYMSFGLVGTDLKIHGYTLLISAIIRDGVSSMVVGMLQNAYREYSHMKTSSRVKEGNPVMTTIHCVSFRCRLRVQAVVDTRNPADLSRFVAERPKEEQLRLVPRLGLIPESNTLLPYRYSGFTLRQWQQQCVRALGTIGLTATSIVTFVGLKNPELVSRPSILAVTSVGVASSGVFFLVCLGTMQRQLLLAVVSSFDFVFIAPQSAVMQLALVEMTIRHTLLTTTIVTTWLWLLLIMMWDALLPSTRTRLGLRPGLGASLGFALMFVLIISVVMIFGAFSSPSINDRRLWTIFLLGHKMELQSMSWSLSCHSTVLVWSLRVVWRLWKANVGELVVLDGPVVNEKRITRRRSRSVRQSITLALIGIAPRHRSISPVVAPC